MDGHTGENPRVPRQRHRDVRPSDRAGRVVAVRMHLSVPIVRCPDECGRAVQVRSCIQCARAERNRSARRDGDGPAGGNRHADDWPEVFVDQIDVRDGWCFKSVRSAEDGPPPDRATGVGREVAPRWSRGPIGPVSDVECDRGSGPAGERRHERAPLQEVRLGRERTGDDRTLGGMMTSLERHRIEHGGHARVRRCEGPLHLEPRASARHGCG